MSSSNYTPGRATGRANSLLRMVPHAWLYSHLMDTSVGTSENSDHKLVLTCTGAVYSFPQLMHTYVMSSTANNSQSVANRDMWSTGRHNSAIR